MTRLFYFLSALVIALLLLTLTATAGQLVAVGTKMIVDYNASEHSLRLSSSMDYAHVRITFDDTPGQYMTVLELRQWIKARPTLKTP